MGDNKTLFKENTKIQDSGESFNTVKKDEENSCLRRPRMDYVYDLFVSSLVFESLFVFSPDVLLTFNLPV